MNKEPVTRKSWSEFRDSGMLWFVNSILHLFGWAIVVEIDKGTKQTICAYPARVVFRGFSEARNTEGYQQVSSYLKTNVADLYKEAFDIEDEESENS